MTYWYRYDACGYFTLGDGYLVEPQVQMFLRRFEVIKETPCGVWLSIYGGKRFARKDAHRKFACPTIEQAKESFLARKRRQIKILETQLKYARDSLVAVFPTEASLFQ